MSEEIIVQMVQDNYASLPLSIGEPVDGKYHCVAVVLSGAVLHNKKLGDFRIDLNTLVYHKSRVPVDYNHEAEKVIGYAENFRVTDAGLVADVYLIEFVEKVCDIITLIKNGAPFEISPSINEEEGIHTVVDGVNVYENVPLRGIAVCPFGTDRFTSLTLLKEETMKKNNITTNLSDEPKSEDKPKVKDPDLAEFIGVYGTDKGLELWQSGADIVDIRTLKELIDKYGVPVETDETADAGTGDTVSRADHVHPNLTLAILTQLHRNTIPDGYDSSGNPIFPQRSHKWGVPVLDCFGRIFAQNQTWQRGEPGGIAPLDENGIVPPQFLAAGWLYSTLIAAIRDQMMTEWSIAPNQFFQNLGDYSRINAFAANETTIVAVGESGRIAWGPNVMMLQAAESPFAVDDSVVGVAYGTRTDGSGVFIAVSQTSYSVSLNGSDWTEAVPLSAGIQGIFYGGGFFLIPDAAGNIRRSVWNGADVSFIPQESSINITAGINSIAYLQDEWVGVGQNNKIVRSTNPAYWLEEQSPAPADTQWNSVFAGDGIFIAVGNYGRACRKQIGGTWVSINTGTSADLHTGVYAAYAYLIAGKNGTLLTSNDTVQWVSRNSKTTSTIRASLYKNERYIIGTDAGQIITSRSIYDVMFLSEQQTGTGPSNDTPNPLGGDGYSGESNQYMRADAVIPDTGVIMEKRVGTATTYKTVINEQGEEVIEVDRYGVPPLDGSAKIPEGYLPWRRGQANGIAPLGADAIVPSEFLPPFDVDIEQIINIIQNGGVGFQFIERITPFPQGPNVPAIIHAGTYGWVSGRNYTAVLCGEAGIGYSQDNGKTWHLVAEQPFGNVPVIGAAYGLDDNDVPVFITIDTNNRYSTSPDGINWSPAITLGGDYDFEALLYYNRTFVILCSNGVILRSVFNNGILTWQEQADSPNITAYCNALAGGNGLFITVGNGGKICGASDASHFTAAASPVSADLLTIAHGKSKFLSGGADNTLLTSSDGSNWTQISSPFSGSAAIAGAGYDAFNGLFIITNTNGGVATSSDLTEWTVQIPSPSSVRIKAITSAENTVILGDDGGNVFTTRVSVVVGGNGGGTGGNAAVARVVSENADGTVNAALLDYNGEATGEIIEDILMLPLTSLI